MKPERPVDLIIIGAQKAGTTALFDYLGDDPAFVRSDVKEVHFFDVEDPAAPTPDLSAYAAHFSDRPGVRVEATPIYIYWPGALERIAVACPGVRLVLLLRDPVERAWSHWRMETARGAESEPFSWCIRRGRQRLFEAEPFGHHREFSYVERGFYGEQVERLYALFDPADVLIARADDLDADPAAVLARLAAFAGTPPPPPVRPRRVHVGAPAPIPEADAAFLRQVYAPDQARLKALTGISWGG
ncbi:MAG: sulfotransferase domain-containing protein [Phenylobacterium sp.]|nr:sulfotransferase domain-containing protein [Phenylobacterium sp.]